MKSKTGVLHSTWTSSDKVYFRSGLGERPLLAASVSDLPAPRVLDDLGELSVLGGPSKLDTALVEIDE